MHKNAGNWMLNVKKKSFAILVTLALIGVLILLMHTRSGIGINPDSFYYIGTARNVLQGNGSIVPYGTYGNGKTYMTHYPPLLPSLLAIIGVFGVDPVSGARWLNACLFGANILLVGSLISKYTAGSFWTAVFGSFLMLNSSDMLNIHSMA